MKKCMSDIPMWRNVRKILNIMKIAAVLVLVLSFHSFANTYGQNQKMTISLENASFKEIIEQIEKESGYYVVIKYDQNLLDKRTDIDFKEATVSEILDGLLKDTGLGYKIIDRYIAISTLSELNSSSQQQKTITGKVTDSLGQSLPGSSVFVKGSTIGVTTNAEGSFSLAVPGNAATLVFSFVGMKTKEVNIGNNTVFNVVLEEESIGIDEIVAIGYGTKIRKEVTGSIAKVTTAELSKNLTSDVTGALQGRTAGVQITQQGGQPGAAMRIRVRGSSSINSSGDPLIVIDGVPISNQEFNGISGLSEINADDIESIDILKDASSAAIYGSRAANGVVLITTKKGKVGKDKIDVSYEHGVTSAVNMVNFVNGDQYQQLVKTSIANREVSGLTGLANYYIIPNNLAGIAARQYGYDQTWLSTHPTNTNWMDYILQTGKYDNASFSMSGGTEKTLFYFSGALRSEEGIQIGNLFERYNGRLNVDHTVNKYLKTGANISITSLKNENGQGSFFSAAQTTMLPIYPLYAPNDPTRYFYDYPDVTMASGAAPRDNLNPLFWRKNYSDQTNTFRSLNTVYLQLTPIKGLDIRTEFGIDFRFDQSRNSKTINLFPLGAFGNQQGGGGRIGNSRFQNMNMVSSTTATYLTTVNKHKFGGMIGNTAERGLSSGNTSIKEGITSDWVKIDGSKHAAGNESENEFRRVSYLGRLNYSFDGKYLAEFNMRRDGSNRFASGFRWGTFTGASAGWIITEEEFMKNQKLVSLLKLRTSYGGIGNDNIGSFKYLSTVYVNWNDGKYAGDQGYLLATLGNNNLTWETTKELSIGLDYGILQNRLSGSIEYYNKKSVNLLLNAPISNAYGWSYTSTMLENVGTITNKGFEFTLNANLINTKSFKWTADFNIARNRAMVDKLFKNLGPNIPGTMQAGGVSNSNSSILVEGQEFGSFFLPIYAGIDPVTGAELIYEVNQTKLTNEGVYELTNNLIDATNNPSLVAANKFLITDKSPFPKFFGGLGTTLTYKGFDLNVLFYFQSGNWIYDANEFYTSYPGEGKQLRASVLDNKNISFIYGSNALQSTRFLHDGSFVRLRNLQLGYNIPRSFTDRVKIKNMRIYASAQNLFTWTKFKGWDPEVFRGGSTDSNVSPGIAEYQLPQVKTIQFGIKLGI
jgi:TonB-linked SusC/RagA family outer membrane protein